ncbi:MAG: YfhO family protein [Lachnospiraceae bacterium]|nr:YfhO family protein [Lachnospiraceae bacterium]
MDNEILDSYEKDQRQFNIYLASFLIPIIIMLGIYAARGIFPFGDEAFLQCDLYHQYFPFLRLFKSIIQEGGSFLYSWYIGIGNNFFSFFVYYLATPTNWLSLIVDNSFLIEFITYIIILKTGFAGLTFSYYLKQKFNSDTRATVLFSLGYSMSAFFAAYNWNVMWLDCLILLPVLILGLERLVYKGRMTLYVIMLGLCIYTNYYLSIMICISLVMYFLVLLISAKGRLRALLRFVGGSIAGGGIASIMLLPEYNSMMYSEFAGGQLPTVLQQYYNVFTCYARSLMNVQVEIGLDHWPNIYCGVALLFLVFLYLFTGRISLLERIPKAILLGIFMFSFCFNIPNFIWHGMNYPNSLPARQSFIYIFLILTMGYEAYLHVRETKWLWVLISGGLGLATVVLAWFTVNDDAFSIWSFTCSLGFIIVFFGLLCLVKGTGVLSFSWFYWISLLLAIAELTTNMMMTGVSTVSRSNYVNEMERYRILSNFAESRDKSFYRIEKTHRETQNDSLLSDYHSASFFSSVSNGLTKKFYERYGMRCTKVYHSYEGATPLTSSLLSVKYIMDTVDRKEDSLYALQMRYDNLYLYRYYYCLPLGFMAPAWDGSTEQTPRAIVQRSATRNISGDVFSRQNALAYDLGAESEIFSRVDCVSSSGNTVIEAPQTGRYYAYVANSGISNINVSSKYRDDRLTFSGYSDNYIMDLGHHSSGDVITISTDDVSYTLKTTVVIFNEDAFGEMYSELQRDPLIINEIKDGYISGTVTADGNKELFLSVAYDQNWEVEVDGVPTEYKPYDDAFISIPLEKGEHEVTLTYKNKYITVGAILSLVFIGIWVVIMWYEKKEFCDET